jgi:hypothetical protein
LRLSGAPWDRHDGLIELSGARHRPADSRRRVKLGGPVLELGPGLVEGIRIRPRWPSSRVRIDGRAFDRLLEVQARLPAEIRLILTRGYEPPKTSLGTLRSLSRQLGIMLFRMVHFRRRGEIADIFGPNGHDVDGTHIDVSIEANGRRLRFLRLGVFTPRRWQERAVRPHEPHVTMVKEALQACGFQLHRNATEALQIHCDFVEHPGLR